jgi:ABC-type spermidine/putrescine transport system permease subunit I
MYGEVITGLMAFYLAYYFRRGQPSSKKWILWILIGVGFVLSGLVDLMRRKG